MNRITATIEDFRAFTQGKKYKTIYADPPWQFQNRTGKVGPEHRRLSRYSTMKREHSRKPDEFIRLIESCSSAPGSGDLTAPIRLPLLRYGGARCVRPAGAERFRRHGGCPARLLRYEQIETYLY